MIRAKEIIGSKVFSQSGCYLGKVIDFEIDTSGQNIVKYYAAGGFFDFAKDLIINSNQVIKIEKGKIIVQDAVLPEKTVKQKSIAECA